MSMKPATAGVYSLKKRAVIFLISLQILLIFSFGMFWEVQDRTTTTSAQVSEILLPAGRLIENAKIELSLQIQELVLGSSLNPSTAGAAHQAQVRLSPSVKTLLSLHKSPLLPKVLRPLFEPWAASALRYQDQNENFKHIKDALTALRDLRLKTEILHRAVQREVSMQVLALADTARRQMLWMATTFVFALLLAVFFVYLIWRWTRPLGEMSAWLNASAGLNLDTTLPPRSQSAQGLLAPPFEVQNLFEALRTHLYRFREESHALEEQLGRTRENERAVGTLFSALHHLTRHNEELISELVKKERLASMSQMAAELAHEIRNPLNSMSLKLELLREDLGVKEQKVLDRVLAEIDRLDALTESHLRTTKAQLQFKVEGKTVGLNQLCSDVIEMQREETEKEGVRIEFAPLPVEQSVIIPENVLRAGLVNLVKNGREAMLGSGDKLLRIELVVVHGEWRVKVLDTGCGFPKDFVFESFRTTKSQGSGLGLATAQKMLAAYGARLLIESPAGKFASCVSMQGRLPELRPQKLEALAPANFESETI